MNGRRSAAAWCSAHQAIQTSGALPSIEISRAAQPRPFAGIIFIPGSEPKGGMSGSPAFVQLFGPRAIRPGSPSGAIVSWRRSTAFSPKPVTMESAIAFVPRIQSITRTACPAYAAAAFGSAARAFSSAATARTIASSRSSRLEPQRQLLSTSSLSPLSQRSDLASLVTPG